MATGASRPRMVLPWIVLSILVDGEGEAARVAAVAALPSDTPKQPRVYVRAEAIPSPVLRRAITSATPELRQAFLDLGGWILEGRGLVLYDRFGQQLALLEREFLHAGAPPVTLTGSPTREIYRSVAPKARARPTVERLIQENVGVVLSRGRDSIMAMWKRGDVSGTLEALRQDVTGLYLLLDLGLKRGTVKLDGKPIPVDWDRRLRNVVRAGQGPSAG